MLARGRLRAIKIEFVSSSLPLRGDSAGHSFVLRAHEDLLEMDVIGEPGLSRHGLRLQLSPLGVLKKECLRGGSFDLPSLTLYA